LPQITKIVLSVSHFFQKARLGILFFIIWIYFLLKLLYKHVILFKIFVDSLMVTVPVVSWVTKTFYMYRFSKLLWQFYNAWISPILSLKLISNIFDNFLYKRKIIEIKRALKSWFTFAESMEWSKLFDPILVQIIHVWEDTWNISQVLKKISEFYSNLLQNKIAILLSLIEPLLIVFIAIIIGMIMWAIFLPMADLVNVIQ
jgi:type II secretory pathway component PulF